MKRREEGGGGGLTGASSRGAMAAAVQQCGRDGGGCMIDSMRPTDGIDWMLLLLLPLLPRVTVICIRKKSPTSAGLSNQRFIDDVKEIC